MIERIKTWWRQFAGCQHPISARDYRFRWEHEYGLYYEECTRCGKEFLP